MLKIIIRKWIRFSKAGFMKILEKDPPLAEECKLPWILVSFLYPLNIPGIFHIIVFTFTPTLLILLQMYVFRYACISSLISLVGFILLIGYGIYFVTYSVFDSSKGQRTIRYIPQMHFPDKWELIRQYFLILAGVAICFWPVVIYYIFLRSNDLYFWLLLGAGLFFFPMSLLSVILFDTISGLNPFFIAGSILRTFVSYCFLILFFYILIGFMVFVLPVPSLFGFIGHALRFYLLLVLANRLGWFYWWHKDKLDWGI